MSECRARVQLLAGHVLYHLDEGRYQDLDIGGRRFSPEESRLALDVAYCLDHVGLILEHEACPLLDQRVHVRLLLLDQLQVLPSCDDPRFHNPLVVSCVSHFLGVRIRIGLSSLPQINLNILLS